MRSLPLPLHFFYTSSCSGSAWTSLLHALLATLVSSCFDPLSGLSPSLCLGVSHSLLTPSASLYLPPSVVVCIYLPLPSWCRMRQARSVPCRAAPRSSPERQETRCPRAWLRQDIPRALIVRHPLGPAECRACPPSTDGEGHVSGAGALVTSAERVSRDVE